MAKFGLIGYPISHSKSPALFSAAYPDGQHTYELLEEQDVVNAVQKFFNGNLKGVNVTSPFKDKVMAYVSNPDRISSLLGSANVLIKDIDFSLDNPVIYSYNTDYYGVKNTISSLLGTQSSIPDSLLPAFLDDKTANVLVVGAGGAGKAAALAMCDMGYNVFLANRSAGKVAEFADNIGAEYVPLENIRPFVEKADLIIYSLSFLIDGFGEYDLTGKIVFEANYANPMLAPEKGIRSGMYINGKKWLYHQAIPAFELFTGETPNSLAMRNVIGIV